MSVQIIAPDKNFKFQLHPVVEIPKAAQTGCFTYGKRFGWVNRTAPENWLDGITPCTTSDICYPLEWYKCSAMLMVSKCYRVSFLSTVSGLSATYGRRKLLVDDTGYFYVIPITIDTSSDVWSIQFTGYYLDGQEVWSFELSSNPADKEPNISEW